jgi:hypothetical protein
LDNVALNCQATQNAHGGNCVATDQTYFIQCVIQPPLSNPRLNTGTFLETGSSTPEGRTCWHWLYSLTEHLTTLISRMIYHSEPKRVGISALFFCPKYSCPKSPLSHFFPAIRLQITDKVSPKLSFIIQHFRMTGLLIAAGL